MDVAKAADLDMDQFKRDFDAATLEAVGIDHEEGVQRYGVFGTPTFVFDNGQAAYMRLRPLPEESEMPAIWQQITDIMQGRPQIQEIKRPVPPAK